MNFNEMNTFLHVLGHCLLHVHVVHPALAYIRAIKCNTEADRLTIVIEVIYALWADHEKHYFSSAFHPIYYCIANSHGH